ncbi:MAG: hypothetical protein R2764_09250 [Bacteroidales bacterium]
MDFLEYFDEDFNFDQVSYDLDQSIPVDEYEGYTKAEIQAALYSIFSEKSPVRVRKDIPGRILDQLPFFRLSEYLLDTVAKTGEVKLTKFGNLPVKLVKHLYEQKFIREPMIEEGFYKLHKEEDSITINISHLILKFAGLLKRRNNKLSLTQKGIKTKSDRVELLRVILATFALRFNWASLDGYGNSRTGQFGVGFTLLMLNKYGNEFRKSGFYSDKYMIAFPALLDDFLINSFYKYGDVERDFTRCFSIRTFEKYLEYFNLIEMEYEGDSLLLKKSFVKTSALFHSVFVFDS